MIHENYFSGFGGYFESEALAGALPRGRNSPKISPKGLYPEQINGSAFTMKRSENLRSWFYRIEPSVVHDPFEPYAHEGWKTFGANSSKTSPSQMRWRARPQSSETVDFVDGVQTMVATANPQGMAVHHYAFNSSKESRFFYNADGEMIFVPELGCLEILTEFGKLEIEPQEIAVIPRGVKFQVLSKDPWCRGYLGENGGQPFRLPDLGPLGANGLANPRDFLYPQAQYWDQLGDFQILTKFNGHLWSASTRSHPLNVVAWHGNYAPYKYDLRQFNTMGTVSYDHPDPSIYTVLTSPSTIPGQANCDFVIFPPRWLVGEETFRPPYYHRNFMNEYMGLIHGVYDAKVGGGFEPGGASLHNCMSPHGPDAQTFEAAIHNSEAPQKVQDTMAFMFESCDIFHPTELADQTPLRDLDYTQCWQNLNRRFEV